MSTYTADELASLTPDERSAVLAEQQPAVDALAAVAGEEIDQAPAAGEESAAAAAAGAGETPPVAEPPAADPDGDAAAPPAPAEPAPFAPQFDATAPDGYDEKLAGLDERETAAEEAFEKGDIDGAALAKQLREIQKERTTLEISHAQAEWAAKQNQVIRDQLWKREVERFMALPTSAMYQNTIVKSAFQAALNEVASNPENAGKSDAWALEAADRLVRDQFQLAPVAKPGPAAVPAPSRKPDLAGVPPTLGAMPAADQANTGDDVMSKIGSLQGDDLDRYVANLSPKEVERLLRAAS